MDSILAPVREGGYRRLYGRELRGLFLQSLESSRFVYRHSASGLTLFYFSGNEVNARETQAKMVELFDFARDSTWVLKAQGEIHELLSQKLDLERVWYLRHWHYHHPKRAIDHS